MKVMEKMFNKINEQKPIKVILKVRNYHNKTEKNVLGEANTPEEALEIMHTWIEKYSTIESHYQRFHNYEDTLVCDYGAHNTNITFTNLKMEN